MITRLRAPQPSPPEFLPEEVSAGGDHALVVLPGSNEAYAVGDNSYGQLGAGHNQVELGEGEGDSSGR